MPNFMKIVQAVKKLNSILRERLNFRRRPILCTTLYRNPMQGSNFSSAFDQIFFEFLYKIFTKDASLFCLYHGAKKSKMTKNSNQGGGPALIPFENFFSLSGPQSFFSEALESTKISSYEPVSSQKYENV